MLGNELFTVFASAFHIKFLLKYLYMPTIQVLYFIYNLRIPLFYPQDKLEEMLIPRFEIEAGKKSHIVRYMISKKLKNTVTYR